MTVRSIIRYYIEKSCFINFGYQHVLYFVILGEKGGVEFEVKIS